ncbi:MAG: H/ACA RNA-protein complex protein Gar1 [Candidatus Heimdallarchaeota archaeon]|nr:H/ACA RNA-protein complex protein Gar1 [Candidatus Heimdallarchaeota archaeon]MCK4877326.1 H/ACA RNA-protein complex protein Gar1 [Candidatus Heimdallarchaeota archaeon]
MDQSRIKKLGNIVHYTDSGNAIVIDPPKLPKIGSHVVSEKMEHIGDVIDIFGPVKKPYVSIRIKPQYKDTIENNTMLYTIDRKQVNVRQRKKSYQKKNPRRSS